MPRTAPPRSRKWCFTAFMDLMSYPQDWDEMQERVAPIVDDALAYIYQLEKAPDTGRLHIQGFAYFKNPISLRAMKNKHGSAHFEISKAPSVKDAWDYCKKPDSAVPDTVKSKGDCPEQGKRSDLAACTEMIRAGSSIREIAENHPETYVRNYRGLKDFYLVTMTPRSHLTRGIVYYGPTRSGKSRHAAELFGSDAYYMTMSANSDGGNSWFDGYDGQEVVIVEDFTGFFRLNTFLNMIDRYPFQVQTKGGFIHFTSRLVVFTSNVHPDKWYANAREKHPEVELAFQARLKESMDVFFVGYGPNMDLEFCPCSTPKECCRVHKPVAAPFAYAAGLKLIPATDGKKRKRSN